MSFLTACTTGRSRALPDVIEYSQEDNTKMADYLVVTCKREPLLCEYFKDYKVMRDQTRKLKGK